MARRTSGGALEKNILYNRWVLYFIGIIALLDLVYLLAANDLYSVVIFLLTGFLTTFFSKNMVVILSLAMSVSFVFKYGTKIEHEGFDSEEDEYADVDLEKEDTEKFETSKEDDVKSSKKSKSSKMEDSKNTELSSSSDE
jgi:hypothetical protein